MVSFGVEEFAQRYGGLKPSQFADMIALSGDRSDNIPGYFFSSMLKIICLLKPGFILYFLLVTSKIKLY